MQKVLDGIIELLKQADDAYEKAETVAKPLSSKSQQEDLSADELKNVAAEAEAAATPVKAMVDDAVKQIGEFEETPDVDEELKNFQGREGSRLRSRATSLQGAVEKIIANAQAGVEKSHRKLYAEMETLREKTVGAFRTFMNSENKSGEEFFAHIKGEESTLTCSKFAEFVKSLPEIKLEDGRAEKLFRHIAGSDAEELSQEKLLELVRLFYKVIKKAVLTETMSIKSKTLRRLEVGEVLEVLEGPKKDDAAGVMRVRCREVNDSVIGWVTVAGNQGTIFLEPGGNVYQCIKETVMTDVLSVSDGKKIKSIAKGDIIEVVEFSKDSQCDVSRIKGKVKNDGTTGWVSISGNQGTPILEPC